MRGDSTAIHIGTHNRDVTIAGTAHRFRQRRTGRVTDRGNENPNIFQNNLL